MFVRNIFRSKFKKISKTANEKLKKELDKNEYVLLNFSGDVYLPEENREEEIIHCSDEQYCNLLRHLRDKPSVFTDYIKKYHFTKQKIVVNDCVTDYINKKQSEIKKSLTKLDIDEYVNNIKCISNRLKKSFIVGETLDNASKIFDNKDSILFFHLKSEADFKFIDKLKNSKVIVLSKIKANSEFKKRNYYLLDNNLFIRQ